MHGNMWAYRTSIYIYIYTVYVLDVMFMEITFPQEALWLSVTFNSHP